MAAQNDYCQYKNKSMGPELIGDNLASGGGGW